LAWDYDTWSAPIKGIDWNTCFLVGGMIPLGRAMTKTGAADLIADTLINVLGDAGPRALLAGLFLAALLAFPRLASRCIIPSAPRTSRARPIQFNGVQG
jgi:di/tricarboxylate transporter